MNSLSHVMRRLTSGMALEKRSRVPLRKDQKGKDMGSEIGREAVQDLKRPLEAFLVPVDLIKGKRRESQDKGDQVINHPEGQHGAQHVGSRKDGREQEDDDCFQNPQPARNLADETDHLGQGGRSQERKERKESWAEAKDKAPPPEQVQSRHPAGHLGQRQAHRGRGKLPPDDLDGFFYENRAQANRPSSPGRKTIPPKSTEWKGTCTEAGSSGGWRKKNIPPMVR